VDAYNAECDVIQDLIAQGKAPNRTVAPERLQHQGLFQLGVDDPIWYDLGLDDESSTAPPRWLCDENMRKGIRAMLLKNRCLEESPRLLRERGHLQIWFANEWKAVSLAIQATDERKQLPSSVPLPTPTAVTASLQYQFRLRQEELLQLYVIWKKPLDKMKFDDNGLPRWGPTQEEILGCQLANVTPSWARDTDADDAEEEDDEEDELIDLFERADDRGHGDALIEDQFFFT
jgi:hypothetical protein